MADYMKKRRLERRKKFINLLGGVCSNCGNTNISQLQFDHVEPKKKEFDLNKIKDSNENTILKELKKCILLCVKCHFEKTKNNKEFVNRDKKPARHGTIWMYKKFKCRCKKCKKAMSDYIKNK